MTLRIPAKVLLHVWSYDFYDMKLSTAKQRRHMIIHNIYVRNYVSLRAANYVDIYEKHVPIRHLTST